jgi:hypothetical protein
MGIMRVVSPLLVSRSSTARGLTVTAIAIAVILLASNFTIINAQQSLTSQPGEIENGTTTATVPTTFQSTTDSFGVHVPEGWVIQDLNNTGSVLLEETRQGYGILAQLCPEDQQQQQQQPGVATASTNASGSISDNTLSCDPSENDVIHIIRYPDLDTRLLANNVTFDDNMTTDNILSYHLQKLQEVGYRSMRIVNSSDATINVANPQTNETIATVPAKLVEMTYSTNFAPNEIRTGYFISTATNATTPNPGTTKGYSVFYEGNSTNTNTTATTATEITTATAASSLLPPLLPPAVRQVIDSFELLAAAEVVAQEEAQTAETTEGGDSGANDDDDDGANDDDDDGANDDDDDGANDDDDDGANDDDDDGANDDDGETSDGGISSRGDRFAGDDYDGDDDDGANDDDGADDYDGDDDDGSPDDDDEFVDDDGA